MFPMLKNMISYHVDNISVTSRHNIRLTPMTQQVDLTYPNIHLLSSRCKCFPPSRPQALVSAMEEVEMVAVSLRF